MPQPINFGRVQLTFQQFNEIASGKYNAGEVRLAGETSLAKINNHVHLTFRNNVSLSHAEVMTIKEAFVKALEGALPRNNDAERTAARDEINRVRQELGLAQGNATYLQLNERSIRPLSRQQIRDIIDRNAAAINAARAQRGEGAIQTDADLHAGLSDGKRTEIRDTRDETNRALAGKRAVEANAAIGLIQSVISGDVDFQPAQMRRALLDEAKRQKADILARSNGHPSQNSTSLPYRHADSGLNAEFNLGMSEAAYVDKLDDMILRLSWGRAPSNVVFAARREFESLTDPAARTAWLNAQASAPDGAFKMRTAAVLLLHARGVDDVATLSLPNRLSDADARRLLDGLLQLPESVRGAALRGDPAVTAFAGANAQVPEAERTFVPALSDHEFSAAILKFKGEEGQTVSPRLGAALNAAQTVVGAQFDARFAPQGDAVQRALGKGYLRSELNALRRMAELYQAATGCTVDVALGVVLDHKTDLHRLFSYGGRFTASAENFKAGIKLMGDFKVWFAATFVQVDLKSARRPTNGASATVLNANTGAFPSRVASRSFEKFLFEEIATNDAIPLTADAPERIFGMEVNPAMRFVGRGCLRDSADTLAQIPQECRKVLYAVFDVLWPLGTTAAEVGKNDLQAFTWDVVSRVLRRYDAVVAMKNAGLLTRDRFLGEFFPDIPNAASMSNSQLRSYFDDKILHDMVVQPSSRWQAVGDMEARMLLANPLTDMMKRSGATLVEAEEAALAGRRMPFARYISNLGINHGGLGDVVKSGRAQLIGDLHRPTAPASVGDGRSVLANADCVSTIVFPDGTVLKSRNGAENDAAVTAVNNGIADKIAEFCGTVHPEQLGIVYYALSQSGKGVVSGKFVRYGITTNEHMPLTYTFSKNANTGAVTIRYSEPHGLPVHFHWETTVALDGSSTSTAVEIDKVDDRG